MSKPPVLRRIARCSSGAAAVEFSMIGFVLMLFCIGTLEIGRGLYLRNQLSHALDSAARGVLTGIAASDDDVEAAISSGFYADDPTLLEISLGIETIDSTVYRTVTLGYPLDLLIPGLSGGVIQITLDRRIPQM